MATEMQSSEKTGFKVSIMYREKLASHAENGYLLEKI